LLTLLAHSHFVHLAARGVEGVGVQPGAAGRVGARPHGGTVRGLHRHLGIGHAHAACVAHLQQVALAHIACAVRHWGALAELKIGREVGVVVDHAGGDHLLLRPGALNGWRGRRRRREARSLGFGDQCLLGGRGIGCGLARRRMPRAGFATEGGATLDVACARFVALAGVARRFVALHRPRAMGGRGCFEIGHRARDHVGRPLQRREIHRFGLRRRRRPSRDAGCDLGGAAGAQEKLGAQQCDERALKEGRADGHLSSSGLWMQADTAARS
jgi:hypothetical protein